LSWTWLPTIAVGAGPRGPHEYMRLQHRHPRSCFFSIITQQLQHPLKHTQFPLSALLSIYIKPSPRPLEPTTSLVSNTIQSARQSRYRHQEDSTPKIFSVSFVQSDPVSSLPLQSFISLISFSLNLQPWVVYVLTRCHLED
jgi:hypothetical protein